MRIKRLLIILTIFVFSSCSRQISPYFKYNKYISDIYYHIINDTLNLYHKSFGDFYYTIDKKTLVKVLKSRKYNFDNVLVYGKTNIDPYYEYYLLHNSKKKWKIDQSKAYVKDTIIADQNFTFIGFSLDNSNPKADFDRIFNNIVVGSKYRKEIVSINDILNRYYKSNKFFEAYQVISELPTNDKSEEWFKLQMQLTYASFLGQNENYTNLLKKWEKSSLNDTIISIITQKSLKGYSAVNQLIQSQVKDQKLVMFNENHFYPNHRKLLTKLLPEFKKFGFKYLALEALDYNQDSLLNAGKPMDLNTGFYTREQNFAELIRTAQSLGFEFVAYENFNEEKERELREAENLYKKTFAVDKNAKVIVLAGIAHITEIPDRNGKKWMASIFKEKYNIEPVTFSQTSLNNYRKLTEEVSVISSSEFKNERYKSADYLILNNLSFREEKGNFKYKNEYNYSIQLALFDNSEFKTEKSYWNKVPIRSYLLKPKETYITNINCDDLRMILFDKTGKILKNEKITFANKKYKP